MGYGLPQGASCRYELLGESGGEGTTITSGGSADTKGSYTTLGTASFNYDGLRLHISNHQGGSSDRYLVDLAVNNGGSDQIIVANMYYDGSLGGAYWTGAAPLMPFIPVAVPAGAILKARCQAAGSSSTLAVSVNGMQGDSRIIRPFRALVNDTPLTGTAPTNSVTSSGTAQSAWAEIISSTSVRYAALYVSQTTGNAMINHRIDVGWGTAASERVLFSIMNYGYGGNNPLLGGAVGPYPCDLPAGTRLAVRAQSTFTGGTVSPLFYGLAA